jgi:pimeloyl-ACP methyl ester carboxylesterase
MRRIERWSETEFGVRLGDGRILGCASHGDPSGQPLLWFPGTPGSRLAVLPEAARQGALRILVVERPGFGRSTAQPGRTVLDFVRDVRELLDALGLGRVTLAGASGAGPYLAACGYALAERLTRVVTIGAVAPLDDPTVWASMSPRRRAIFALARRAPGLFRTMMDVQRFQRDPGRLYRTVVAGVAPCDRAIIERTWEKQLAMTAEALRQGTEALAWEMHMVARPWGFRLEEIEAEVHVFQGLEDRSSPPAMGRYLAEKIPGAKLHPVPGAGHFLHADHWDDIAAVCAGAMGRRD